MGIVEARPGPYDRCTMRAALALTGLLITLLVFTPFVCASTYESWTEGLYDAELENDVLALRSLQAVVAPVVLPDEHCIGVVVAMVTPANDTIASLADLSTPSARAPPTS